MKQHAIVVRTWQIGLGHKGIKLHQADSEHRIKAIELMLQTSNNDLARIVVVVNGDDRFPQFLGEAVAADGTTPTVRKLRNYFGSRIDILVERNWGNNAGSAVALNTGWQYAARTPEVDLIISWNPDMALTGHHVTQIRHHMYRHGLEICGYLREGHWKLPQFGLPQNSACAYTLSILEEASGFSEHCDGKDGVTISTEHFGLVPCAGMDDGDFIAHITALRGEPPRIGMVGQHDPAPWKTVFPGEPKKQANFNHKVERQYAVLQEWVTRQLPHTTLEEHLHRIFRNMFIG